MGRVDTFTFRVNANERWILAALADKLQRSQSDAVRWLIRKSARELGIELKTNTTNRAAHLPVQPYTPETG